MRIASEGSAVAATLAVYEVGPHYFGTIGAPVLAGRDFTAGDVRDETPPVAVVSQGTARLLWGNQPPMGRLISLDGGASVTVVGVVRDTSRTGIRGARQPAVYVPGPLRTDRVGLGILIRTAGRAEKSLPAIRASVTSVFADPVQLALGTAAADIRDELAAQRFAAWLFSWFGALALGLGGLGLWGVVSTAVLRRRKELAIRLALGAEGAKVAWRTVAEAVAPVTLGSAIGLVIGALVSQGLAACFAGVSRFDALSCIAAAGLLHAVACAAACAGTKGIRAMDPAVLLRES
jgi:hypothetical protein